MRRLALAVGWMALALAGAPVYGQARPSPAELAAAEARTVPLAIETRRGIVRFRVEVARTATEQELGLMYRRHMDARHGMIFPTAEPRQANFWMKNTYIPLDLVFVRADGRIASIAADAPPLSLDIIASTEPVVAVLELNGGAAAREGIRAGDGVRWGDQLKPLRRAPHRG